MQSKGAVESPGLKKGIQLGDLGELRSTAAVGMMKFFYHATYQGVMLITEVLSCIFFTSSFNSPFSAFDNENNSSCISTRPRCFPVAHLENQYFFSTSRLGQWCVFSGLGVVIISFL